MLTRCFLFFLPLSLLCFLFLSVSPFAIDIVEMDAPSPLFPAPTFPFPSCFWVAFFLGLFLPFPVAFSLLFSALLVTLSMHSLHRSFHVSSSIIIDANSPVFFVVVDCYVLFSRVCI